MKQKILAFVLAFMAGMAAAAPSMLPGTCIQDKADVCVDATPCKNVSGMMACLAGTANPPSGAVMLSETCWKYDAAFTCADGDKINSCQPLRDKGCAQTNAQCVSRDANNVCMSSTLTFQCPDQPPKTTEKNVCTTNLCAADGAGCFDTSHPADKDFGNAAVMNEIQREAGVYGIKGGAVDVFKGYMEECSVKTIGGSEIKSCCDAAGGGGAFSNYSVIGVTAKAAYAVGSEEMRAGSKYVYDALFSSVDPSLIQEGMGAAAGGLSSGVADGVASSAGTNFGAYGFEFSYAAEGGFSFVSFDPYSFAFAIAMQIITQWLQCEPEEQNMQMKRGQKLCEYITSYCDTKVLGVCTVKKEKHCCFNSVLAKIINRQGRPQLGMPMDQCGGFNQEQIQALDFSAMDFSEFVETIAPTLGDEATRIGTVGATVTQKINDYYGNGPGPN